MIHPRNKVIMEAAVFTSEDDMEVIPISVEKTDLDEIRIDIPMEKLKEGTLFLSLDHLEHAIRMTKERFDVE